MIGAPGDFAILWVVIGLISAKATSQGDSLLRREDGFRWQPEEPKGIARDALGGNSGRNAFLGETQFLHDASEHTDQVHEQRLQHISFARLAAAAGVVNLASLGSDQNPYDSTYAADVVDLDADGAAAKKQAGLKANNGALAKESAKESIFTAEQPLLKAISATTTLQIKWAAHPEKCLCGQRPTNAGENVSLVIWDCNDVAKANDMKFHLPTGELGHGKIVWAPDHDKCIYVDKGWEGNGNRVFLGSCHDTMNGNLALMTFTVESPAEGTQQESGRSAIKWVKPGSSNVKCLEVHNLENENGNPIELWDCVETMWEIY